MSDNNFNLTHPELRELEVFSYNVREEDIKHCIGDTRRVGDVAYDHKGNVIEGKAPVFVTPAFRE